MRIEARNLAYGFNNNIVGSNIYFEVAKGEMLFILGPNGIGKTTLIKTILNLLGPLDGDILIDNLSISDFNRKELGRIFAYVPQNNSFNFPFKVIDMILMGRTPYLEKFQTPKKKDYEIAFNSLEILNISHLENKPFTNISGGEKQLVLIARALTQEANFLVLDEPTSSLDFGNEVKLLKILEKLSKRGMGVIMATHNPNHAVKKSGKILLLKGKKDFYFGSSLETLTKERLEKVYETKVDVAFTKKDKKVFISI